jgi:RNA polymerase sigma-70 factor (ECF subfamily)
LPETLREWFCREVLPHEAALTRFIRRNWKNEADVAELRQDVYVRVFEAAREQRPLNPKAYLFTTARNQLINAARRARIVSIDLVADLEASPVLEDEVTPERCLSARDELRRVQAALERMPERRREIVMLKKIEGLSQNEIAGRLGVSVSTVEKQLSSGMRFIADWMLGGSEAEVVPLNGAKEVKA